MGCRTLPARSLNCPQSWHRGGGGDSVWSRRMVDFAFLRRLPVGLVQARRALQGPLRAEEQYISAANEPEHVHVSETAATADAGAASSAAQAPTAPPGAPTPSDPNNRGAELEAGGLRPGVRIIYALASKKKFATFVRFEGSPTWRFAVSRCPSTDCASRKWRPWMPW